MDSSDSGSRAPLDEPDGGPAAGSLPVEPADNGEPVLDPDSEDDEPGQAASAGVERLERHNRSRDAEDDDTS
jgi:hypothetical protein